MTAKPLTNLRVVELGQVLAAPFAGAIFADLGAEVIKIERPKTGDDARHMGPEYRPYDSVIFQVFNRGKSSVTLDLTKREDRNSLLDILKTADIFIHNLRPDVPRKLEIDSKTICSKFPKLIYCSISAFGEAGPQANYPGYEPLVQAYSGLSSINGGPDDPPMRAGPSLCDQGSGMWIVIGALAMLQRRNTTGRGGVVSTSLLETALSWVAQKSDTYLNQGVLPERHRSGHPGFVPYQQFETLDKPIIICCGNDRLFGKFAEALGRPDWTGDPRYQTNRNRLLHKESLIHEIELILGANSRKHWMELLIDHGVPCAPVHDVTEIVNDSQVLALDMLLPVPGTEIKLTATPLKFDSVRPSINSVAPSLGSANRKYI